jgi:hypothetical protein
LEAPVAVPDSTNREPKLVVRMLALTPGLLVALLIAATMPCRLLSLGSMAIEVDAPPTLIVKVPVPITVVSVATGCEARLAAVAKLVTCSEYWAGTASEVAVAEAMVVSARLAVRPANEDGFWSVVKVACSVASALLNVPKAETCALSAVLRSLSALVCGALAALVRDETMLAMSSPEPMPCDDMRVLRADGLVVDVAGVLIGPQVPFRFR